MGAIKIPGVLEKRGPVSVGRTVGECLIGCWVIALLTFAGYVLHFNPAPVGFLFLLIVVCFAILFGFWQASIVSLVACLCLDFFFYPPLFHLTVDDPQDWVALAAFEISALLVSQISSREQVTSREAEAQRRSMEQLYELSRSTLLINMHHAPGPQLSKLIQRIFGTEGVAIFDANSGQTDLTGAWSKDEQDLARECYLHQADDEDRPTRTSRRLLWVGTDSVGAIAIRGDLGPLVTNALASLTAVTLDRHISFEKENRIEAAHQSERLRAAVLDSLAHAVKTPLTAIQTANEGLAQVGPLTPVQQDLSTLIDDELNSLSLLSNRLLQTAKLEAQEMQIAKDEIEVNTLVASVLKGHSKKVSGHRVEVRIAENGLKISGDRELLSMAVGQYLDNAAKYSFAESPITVSAWESHAQILISVHNLGPPIPLTDRERVFERFFRCEGTMHRAPGTGVGLSAVKMAAEAHRGHVWVISNANEGTTFFMSLPQRGGQEE